MLLFEEPIDGSLLDSTPSYNQLFEGRLHFAAFDGFNNL
jgi:hypothetical protein